MLKILVGSHNYGLNDESSDKDYKIFVMPSFDDLYYNKAQSTSETGVIDVETKDIRLLLNLIRKANTAYLEIMFSTEVECNHKGFNKIYQFLLEHREEIVRSNLKGLFDSTHGTIHQKYKNIFKPTEKTQTLFDKVGYNVKNLMHLKRLEYLLFSYMDSGFTDFKSAIYIESQEIRNLLMEHKRGQTKLEFVQSFCLNTIEDVKCYQSLYYNNHKENPELMNELQNLIYQEVRLSLAKALEL